MEKKKPGHGVYRYKSFISIFGSEASNSNSRDWLLKKIGTFH